MRSFSKLYNTLDGSTRTNDKIDALVNYFETSTPEDAIWAIALLFGKRPRRPVKTNRQREWVIELAQIPEWLFQECHDAVGDLSETFSLLIEKNNSDEKDLSLAGWMEEVILRLPEKTEGEQREILQKAWKSLDDTSRFLFNKLIGGSFRVGVSDKIVITAVLLSTQ